MADKMEGVEVSAPEANKVQTAEELAESRHRQHAVAQVHTLLTLS